MELWPLPGFDEREDAMVDLRWGGHQGGTVAGHPVGQQPCKGGGGTPPASVRRFKTSVQENGEFVLQN